MAKPFFNFRPLWLFTVQKTDALHYLGADFSALSSAKTIHGYLQ